MHLILVKWEDDCNGCPFTLHSAESTSKMNIFWTIDEMGDPHGTEHVEVDEVDLHFVEEVALDCLLDGGCVDDPSLESRLMNLWNEVKLRDELASERGYERAIKILERSNEALIEKNQDLLMRLAQVDAEKLSKDEVKELLGPPRKRPVFVYLMKDKVNGLYKIGKSVNPKSRERTLQSEKPSISMVFSELERDGFNEATLHRRYADIRVRGEWFDLSRAQVRLICNEGKSGSSNSPEMP